MPQEAPTDVTALLRRWRGGDETALEHLVPLVQQRLRELAHAYTARERRDPLLQTTSLVNEAFIRLVQIHRIDWEDRSHFLAMAATIMRRVLVESARERAAQKRGGGHRFVEFDESAHGATAPDVDVLGLNQSLDRLATVDPRAARVIEMRFFAGLTVEEAAVVLDVSPNTVKRDWAAARLWLLRELRGGGRDGA